MRNITPHFMFLVNAVNTATTSTSTLQRDELVEPPTQSVRQILETQESKLTATDLRSVISAIVGKSGKP